MGKKKQPIPQAKEVLTWQELLLAKRDAGEAIMGQQLLIIELSKLHEKTIDGDSELYLTIKGLLQTLEDLAKDVNTVSLGHAVETTVVGEFTIGSKFKEGLVSDGEDQMEYISIAAHYLSVVDKVAHLAGTAYLDVFTRLKTDTAGLEKAIADGSAAVAEVQQGETDGK